MATLTNTQISVTYVGLLKTSGNTILDSTPQQITDGSGNNSQLFLSTAKVGIGATPSGSDTLQVQGSISITGDGSNATTLTESGSGDFTIDSADDIRLDAGGGDIVLRAAGTEFGRLSNDSTNLVIQNTTSDKDIIFKGSDDGSTITAMTIDMSAGGNVGIGTTSPDSLLEISSSSVTDFLKLTSGGSSANPIKFIFEKSSTEQGIIEYNRNGDLEIYNTDSDGGVMIDGSTSAGADFYINNSGDASFGGDVSLVDSKFLKIGTGSDLRLSHNGTDSSINNYTGNLNIANLADDKDIIFKSDDGSGGTTEYFRLDGSVGSGSSVFTVFPDNSRATFGTGLDLQIYHDATDSYIKQQGGGDLIIEQTTDDKDIILKSDDGSGSTTEYFRLDGGTTSMVASKNIGFIDNIRATFGAGADLAIYHNGTTTNIENINGKLRLIQTEDDGDISFESDDGSGGTTEYFRLDGGLGYTVVSKLINFSDDVAASFGGSGDLNIRHDGTDNLITGSNGDIVITNNADDKDVIFQSDDGSGGVAAYLSLDGSTTMTKFQKNVMFQDSVIVYYGTGFDFFITHDGTNTSMTNQTGNLTISNSADDSDITFNCDDGSGGTTEYFRVDGGSTDVRFSKNTRHLDNVRAEFGSSGDFVINHDGTDTLLQCGSSGGDLILQVAEDDKDIRFKCDDGSGGVTEYFRLDGGSKQIRVSEEFNILDNVKGTFGNSNDLQLYHTGTKSLIVNVNGDLDIQNQADDGDILFKSDDGSGGVTEYFRLNGDNTDIIFSKPIELEDNVELRIGSSGADLRMLHNGTNSFIQNFTGDLEIQQEAADKDILFRCDDGTGSLATYFFLDGSNSHTNFQLNARWVDDARVQIGNSADLEIYHNGSNTEVQNQTGNLNIKSTNTDGDIKFFLDDGSGGTTQYVRMDGGEEQVLFLKSTEHQDNVKATFGTAGDLEIYHDGSNSYITNSTGELLIQDDDTIRLQKSNGENMLRAVADGSVELYENNVKKFETTTSGVAVTGGMTLSGDVEGRKIPFVFRSSFDDSAGSTSIFVIPFDANVETTVSGADEEHIIIAPYAGELTKVQWKHVKGTLDTGFTTELFLYVNGSQQTSSGELTASSDAITWSPTSSNTFSAGDELMIAYQKSATSKDWEHVSVSVVFSFTGYNI